MGTSNVRLSKIVAVEKTVKSKSQKSITNTHRKVQKPTLLSGLSRVYQPRDEEGEILPPESTQVQYSAEEAIAEATERLESLFDVVATKDWGNTQASADLVVEGKTLVEDVPVTYLLFLEKQAHDLNTFVSKIPVLDPSENWEWDSNQNCFRTEVVETNRTKKVPRVLVRAEATEHHPAQTEVWHEDIVVGTWKTTKYSGALPKQRKERLLAKVESLLKAIKFAREEANATEVPQKKVGAKILNWLFE